MRLFYSPPFLEFTAAPNWSILNSPDVSTTSRAPAAPQGSLSLDMDGRQCFQGCSGIPALLPELWLLLASGLTLTSSGAGNSGIFPPNSKAFPPTGRNPHNCYQTSVSKLGYFFPGHSFCFFHPHICTQTQMHDFLSITGVGDLGFNRKTSVGMDTGPWGSQPSLRAPKRWQNFPLAEGGELRFPSEYEEMALWVLYVKVSMTSPLE